MTGRTLKSVAVFCGSNAGNSDNYASAARSVGTLLAHRNMDLVCGGTSKGLMSELIVAAADAGGKIVGIVPRRLADQGQQHPRLSTCEIAETMQARKQRMFELADAFIAIPGGMGTIQELTEVVTLNQLGQIDKPIGLLDVEGFFSDFMEFVSSMVRRGFLPEAHRSFISVKSDPDGLLDAIIATAPISGSKWQK
ncbi:MAG: TIGR00730 family Rossman fold protein [Hyphomicrobiaceae bacterium]